MDQQLNYQFERRLYFGPDRFWEMGIVASGNLKYSKSNMASYYYYGDGNTYKNYTFLAYLPFKYGIGRIEPVEDARQAYYIYDELMKVGRFAKEISQTEIFEFASLISKLKNKRFFDARMRKIAELEAIDSFLVSKNYLSKQDARYFTTLTDFWDYGCGSVRLSGTRIAGILAPGYGYGNWDFNSGEYDTMYKIFGGIVFGGAELILEKPINLYWQKSFFANAVMGYTWQKIENFSEGGKGSSQIPYMQLGLSYCWGYFPNTRTNMNLT